MGHGNFPGCKWAIHPEYGNRSSGPPWVEVQSEAATGRCRCPGVSAYVGPLSSLLVAGRGGLEDSGVTGYVFFSLSCAKV